MRKSRNLQSEGSRRQVWSSFYSISKRLELLDDGKHILNARMISGDHRLRIMDSNKDEASQHCVPTHTDVPIQTGSAPPHQSTVTFWTMCHGCSKRFEYLIIYHNCTIGCFNCYKPFLASKAAPPANCGEWRSAAINVAGRRAYRSGRNFAAAQKSGAGQFGGQSPFSCEESNAGGGWGCSKKRTRNGRKKTSVGSGSGIRTRWPQRARELTPLETREMLMHKARKVIAQRLSQSTMPHQEP